jgi:hypothetical protein
MIKMEENGPDDGSSKQTSVYFNETTRRYISEDVSSSYLPPWEHETSPMIYIPSVLQFDSRYIEP